MVGHSFGTWIRRGRKALDLTQQQLAERVGCSLSLIFKIESDERRPSRQVAELLAEHLGIPPEQRELFLKVARQEKSIHRLDSETPDFAPEPTAVSQLHRNRLPIPLTSLVGREHKLHAVIEQIQNIRDLWSLSRTLNFLGYFHLARGDQPQAYGTFVQAGHVAATANAHPGVLESLTGLAILDARYRNYSGAMERVLFILQHPAS